ncbi:charged multivesicular body protein 7 [Cataglyphis hispanica]|uniref:charged multivesicular body protein 7 n=1 Tax=Cataglyphis hispanica TaxID=1086592 RepID=UPI00217FECD2|nr:charged multivesicular body protein 7 [Cataglyphis hispanica]XP_050449089.1 charged multivesicular body protein 7 [Cataglyphis hispanica]XP_050449090.1 charged multivesicular body protein 7 [Cataglyphis hispanica]XP_050449091.1 charged multivesicular body protein 7 [Cataglyphis hispanica]
MNEISINNKMIDKNTSGNILLPSEKLPECWNQEERMSALFSPFRSKSANPQDWISKYKFWHDLIYEWLKYNMQCSFSIIDLNEAFKRRGCTPLCLITVIEELLRNNEIIQETDFFQEPCETWAAWSIDIFIKKPISWSFSKVKNYIVGQNVNNTEVRYIHLRIVQELGDIILSIADIKKDNILFSISEIVEYCENKTKKHISENTVRLVLEWLRHRKKISVKKNFDSHNELLIKICTQTVNEITEVEEGIYKLIKQENELIKEIELMEQEKLNIINETKSYLAKGLRQMAKTRLRRKMELEKTIEKRAQTLTNLRTLITNIEDAHSNVTVLSAYKTGSDILKKIQQDDLTEHDVRDIMDDINELLEEKQEIDSVLSESLHLTDSDAELEKELAELLNKDNDDIDDSNIVSESNPEIEKIEQRLKDLCMEGIESPGKNRLVLPTVPSRKDKALKEL